MIYSGNRKGSRDYLRSCSYCGRLVLRSTMTKKDGMLACKDDARGREQLTLDRLNAMNLKPARWRPARDRLSDRDNEQDVYQADEAVLFNLMAIRTTTGKAGNNGAGPALNQDTLAVAYVSLALADIITEAKRPLAWIAAARAALKTNADFILSMQMVSSEDLRPTHGAIIRTTTTLFDVETCGVAGNALLRAYQILGDIRYLLAARRCVNFIRNMQFSAYATQTWTSSDSAGVSHYYTGFWSHQMETTLVNIDPPDYARYDHNFYPGDLVVLDFLRAMLKADGDALYGSGTIVNGFFSQVPRTMLSQMISDAMLMWDNGLFDVSARTFLNGLSASTPREFFNAYPTNKNSPVFTSSGTGSWALSSGSVNSLNWAKGIRAILNSEGYTNRLDSLWSYLQGIKADPSFATPANTSDYTTARANTGAFDATLCPPVSFNPTTDLNSSSQYDWAAWGMLSPIFASRNLVKFMTARAAIGLKRSRSQDPWESFPTDYVGIYGRSGLSYQTFTQAGIADFMLMAMVNNNYRQAPILFPMSEVP